MEKIDFRWSWTVYDDTRGRLAICLVDRPRATSSVIRRSLSVKLTADRDGSAAPQSPARGGRWRRVRPGVYLVLGGVSLYLLLPATARQYVARGSLLSVFGSWRSLSHLDWPFAILALACETASYVCLWEVDRIALGTRA